jgi:hypothetical protein
MKDDEKYSDGELPTKHELTIAMPIGNDFKPVGWECMAPLPVEAATHGAGRTGAKKGACRQAGS